MRSLVRETSLLLRSPAVVSGLLLLLALAGVAVASGLHEVAHQHATIDAVTEQQATDLQAVARHVGDAGDAAYYTFHVVTDRPSKLAFAAHGQRDVAPGVLRIRALALEAQLYENETGHPELAAIGSLDHAFVVLYLAPLALIALMHDLQAGERAAGRLVLLQSMPWALRRLWLPRVLARALLVLCALWLPFSIGAIVSGTSWSDALEYMGLTSVIVAFWSVVGWWFAGRSWSGSTIAAGLVAVWFAITLVVPAAAHLAINAAIPIPAGAGIARANREAVHDGWDLPRNETLSRFIELHPEWSDTPELRTPFHWKWYFAFQHLGDVEVADAAQDYRRGIEARERWARRVGWMLPPIAAYQAMHRIANTDTLAQLAFQDRIRSFHAQLRRFYYPYLFEERPFAARDFALAPRFESEAAPGS